MAPPFCPPERPPIWRRLDSACCYDRSRCSRQPGGSFAADLAGAAVPNLQSRPGVALGEDLPAVASCHAGATGLLRRLLELVLTAGPMTYLTGAGRRAALPGFNEQPIRGVVSAAGLADPRGCRTCSTRSPCAACGLCRGHVYRDTLLPAERIPCACIRALAASGPDACLRAAQAVSAVVDADPQVAPPAPIGAVVQEQPERGAAVREAAVLQGAQLVQPGDGEDRHGEDVRRARVQAGQPAGEPGQPVGAHRSEEHTSELQSPVHLVC